MRRRDFLTFKCPKISGAIDLDTFSYIFPPSETSHLISFMMFSAILEAS